MLQMDVGQIATALHPFLDCRDIRWVSEAGEEGRLKAQDKIEGSGPGSWFEQRILCIFLKKKPTPVSLVQLAASAEEFAQLLV